MKAPALSDTELIAFLQQQYALTCHEIRRLDSYDDQNFRVDDTSGASWVVKISNSRALRLHLQAECAMLQHLAKHAPQLRCSRLRKTVDMQNIAQIQHQGKFYFVRVLVFVEGGFLADCQPHSPQLLTNLGTYLGQLSAAMDSFSHPGSHRQLYWDLCFALQAESYLGFLPSRQQKRLIQHCFLQIKQRLLPHLPLLRRSVIHNDANDYNLLVDDTGQHMAGMIDVGDMLWGVTACELAVALTYVMMNKEQPLKAAKTVIAAYHQVFPLQERECEVLLELILSRLCLSVLSSAKAKVERPHNIYVSVSEEGAWKLLRQLIGLPREVVVAAFHNSCGFTCPQPPQQETLLASRYHHLSPSLSLQYKNPLHMFRGLGCYLYADDGRAYLDMVNNVCHVGHSHPKVVTALQAQAAMLNTNTRYLHPNILRYAERLTAKLPEPLSVCFFTCSGSEANELALRLAYQHTQGREVVVLEGGYHGNSNALIEISSYKFDGKGGKGAPEYVHVLPMPDPFRGRHRGAKSGSAYAQYCRDTLQQLKQADKQVAAFFAESILGCGGQIVLPDGYLAECYHAVRAAGGVCVADEVQVGFGRVGDHFWGFESQQVIPDIVVMGKPIGNGHPLAAVVTTPEIAQSFCNGMEYFNTFGGNPVSMAVGLAVLDIIEEEHLQENAKQVGQQLLDGLKKLALQHSIIGDVRGMGLFLGVELVHADQSPAADEATWVVNRLKERGILLSTDGPQNNVLKMKPPLVFSAEDGEFFLQQLEQVLHQLS